MSRIPTVVLFGGMLVSMARADEFGPDREYTIVNEQIEPIPLPFQAAVFRRTFRNDTDHVLTPPYPEHGAVVRQLKGPGESGYRMTQEGVIGMSRGGSGTWLGLSMTRELLPLALEPGMQSTLRYSFAARWESSSVCTSVLPEPGTHSFELYYDDELRVVVREPQGDDKLIVDLLRANPDLAAAMMSPYWVPPDELMPSLKRIVDLYPESSYTDYARFALARRYAYRPDKAADVPEGYGIQSSELLKRMDASFAYVTDALLLRHEIAELRHQDERAEAIMANPARRLSRLGRVPGLSLPPTGPRRMGQAESPRPDAHPGGGGGRTVNGPSLGPCSAPRSPLSLTIPPPCRRGGYRRWRGCRRLR